VCDLAEILAQVLNRYSAEERLVASRTAEVSTLVDLGLTIPRQEDLFSALNRLLNAAVQLTGYRAAAFFLLNPTTNELNLRALTALESNQIPMVRRNLAQNPPDLEALVRGQKLVRRNGSPEGETWLPPVAAAGLCLAVQSDAGPLGSLWVFDRRDRVPSEGETHALEAISAQVAGILERVELRFFPQFVLASTEYKKEYLDRVIPAALAPIRAREFPGRQVDLHNSLSISEVPIGKSDETADRSVWGVATWVDVDPKIDYYIVYVQGLTNAYQFEDPAGAFKKGDAPGTGRQFTRKTLQLNFWRPGDTVDPHEEEIRFGTRIDPDPADQAKILAEFGIDKPIDYRWLYR
jgi:hypothetical protein